MTDPISAVSYLICGTPRTGSTLLCGLLRSTGVAGRPESYFRQQDEQCWARRWRIARDPGEPFGYQDYVRAAIAAGSTGNGVFGARVMWGTLDEMLAKLGAVYPDLAGADPSLLTAAFGGLRYVHLWREYALAQAVSWARAEQTNHWQPGDIALHEPRFDVAQIDGLVKTIEEHNAAWRGWFAASGIQPHQVRYEELAEDMAGVTLGVLGFLGLQLPGDQAIVAEHQPQADEINTDWIARYRAIARRRRETVTQGSDAAAVLEHDARHPPLWPRSPPAGKSQGPGPARCHGPAT